MPDVKIGTDDNCLLLIPRDSMDASPSPQALVAEFHLDGLPAPAIVVHHNPSGFQDLAEFFAQHAQDWRGWEGFENGTPSRAI
jgi:hypothetical protein